MDIEINSLREKLDNFMAWTQQREESNMKKLSYLNKSFDILLKLFVSKSGTLQLRDLNVQPSPITNEVVNGFSDEKDREESSRINSSLLQTLSCRNVSQSNKQTQTDDNFQTSLSLIDEEEEEDNSVTDGKILTETEENFLSSETSDNNVLTKSVVIGGRYYQPAKFHGKIYRENLRNLKRRHDDICTKFPNCSKLPDSYLEYGAARGWEMRQIRYKYNKNRSSVRRRQRVQTLNVIKSACLKKEDIEKHVRLANSSPVLDLTPEEYQANLKSLRDEHMNSSKKRISMPDFYFQFGAARGWNLKQVSQKFYHTTSKERLKQNRKLIEEKNNVKIPN